MKFIYLFFKTVFTIMGFIEVGSFVVKVESYLPDGSSSSEYAIGMSTKNPEPYLTQRLFWFLYSIYFRLVDDYSEVRRTFVYISGRACMDNATLEFRFDIQ
jgi:hypothetical protein